MTTYLSTTFELLRASGACEEGYKKLAKHLGGVRKYGSKKEIPASVILESNGIADALWSLRAALPDQEKERDRVARLMAADFAESVLHLYEQRFPGDSRPRASINAARSFANGALSREDLDAARDAAGAAARDAAWDAAGAAAGAAARDAAWAAAGDAAGAAAGDAAGAAAWAAAWAAEKKIQADIFRKYIASEKQP